LVFTCFRPAYVPSIQDPFGVIPYFPAPNVVVTSTPDFACASVGMYPLVIRPRHQPIVSVNFGSP
jgi:hypothetical protein